MQDNCLNPWPEPERIGCRLLAEPAADAASHAMGYTSPSQFSREFKRLFGLTPAAEARRMRENFAVPAFVDSTYVSSH